MNADELRALRRKGIEQVAASKFATALLGHTFGLLIDMTTETKYRRPIPNIGDYFVLYYYTRTNYVDIVYKTDVEWFNSSWAAGRKELNDLLDVPTPEQFHAFKGAVYSRLRMLGCEVEVLHEGYRTRNGWFKVKVSYHDE